MGWDNLKTSWQGTLVKAQAVLPFMGAAKPSTDVVVFNADANLPVTVSEPLDMDEIEKEYFESIKGGYGC